MEFLEFDNSDNEACLVEMPEAQRHGTLDELIINLASCLKVDAKEIKTAIQKLAEMKKKQEFFLADQWEIVGIGQATDEQDSIILRREEKGFFDIHLTGYPTRKYDRESGEMINTICFRAESVSNKIRYSIPGNEIRQIWQRVFSTLDETT